MLARSRQLNGIFWPLTLLLLVEILRAGFQYPRLVNPLVPVLVPALVVHEVLEIPGVAGLGVLPRLDALGLVQQGAMIAKDLQVRNWQMSEYRIRGD